jgi:rRNA processing protein Krr1/Pno1
VSNASIDEIAAALAKVKLANKLGCKTQELIKKEIDCPQTRIGAIIGKNGTMVKKIMESCKVTIDVDKEKNKIEITGSEESVAEAIGEIDAIIRSIDTELEPPKELINYLTAKHVKVIARLKEEHPLVYMDVLRASGKIIIRGTPEKVEEMKQAVLGLELATKERKLEGREFSILLGKKGATIDRLVSTYEVSIEVDKVDAENSTASVTGPPAVVDAIMTEIDAMMDENREVIEKIPLDVITKRILLVEAGKRIKATQAKVNEGLKDVGGNCYLHFEKSQIDSDHPELLVKVKQSIVAKAVELTEEALKEIRDLVVNLQVDSFIAPRLIGKGGETIKKLTKGKTAYVEVDRTTGEVSVGATTVEERDAILEEINDIVAKNQIIRVPASKDLLKAQFREFNRSKSKAAIAELAWVGIDDETGHIILRGRAEDLEKAKDLIEEFLANNYLDEVATMDEDLDALLAGGRGSIIMKMSEDLGVYLNADRGHHAVVIRGGKEKVDAAKQKLNQFLNGGDGYTVGRLSITEEVVGVVIGKGGKTRKELEQKHGGVSINVSKTHRVTIRGLEDGVASCRVEILKMVASARVTQSLDVSEEQEATLKKKDALKRIMAQTPAHIAVSNGKATIRGVFYDVRDAVSLLNEQLTGEYSSFIEFDASQFSKVRAASRDPSHFERMETETSSKVALDLAAGSIVVSGKRTNVKRAKDQVYGFLSFVLPGEIERVKITKPLQLSVGQAVGLAEISASVGGAVLYLDRDLSSIVIRSSDQEKVTKAVELVEQKIQEAEKLAYCLGISPQEAWLVPLIIGKNGSRIASLQKDSGCKIDVSSESRTVTVIGDSEEHVANVRESLTALIEKARKENAFIAIPENCIAPFMGKGGNRIKEFSIEHGAEVLRIRKGPYQFKITGEEDKVEATRKAIDEWLVKWEQTNGSVTIPLEKTFIPVVLGLKGETARALQDEFGCRIDVDRKEMTCTIRGGNDGKRQSTLEKIQEIIAKEKEAKAEVAAQRKQAESTSEAPPPESKPIVQNGSTDSIPADEAIDRSTEFPSQPVGVKKTNSGRNGKKSKPVDASVQQGTTAGRNLFNLLVSEAD